VGSFIVLDGKQRLLSLLQFCGKSESRYNAFRLPGLDARIDLMRKRFSDLKEDASLNNDLNAFLNHTIRTVVIRNWPSTDFLHLVFLRLNTGSVTLSPQELRQAMVPGPFSDFVDDEAINSEELKELLGRTDPDPRMRDVELLVRYLYIRRYLPDYGGRMKSFLDKSCERMNSDWKDIRQDVEKDLDNFGEGVRVLFSVFGEDEIARKEDSYSFNRAIFDALIYYAADQKTRSAMAKRKAAVKSAYSKTLKNPAFAEAIRERHRGNSTYGGPVINMGYGPVSSRWNRDPHASAGKWQGWRTD
jgi:hypothetical protein